MNRFWSKVNKNGSVPEYRPDLGKCWLWMACTDKGYGIFSLNGKNIRAHRLSLILAGIDIPENLVPDHLCRVRKCVNPSHMEITDQRTNLIRGISPVGINHSKTHCLKGHPLMGDNLRVYKGRRLCRACRREQRMNYYWGHWEMENVKARKRAKEWSSRPDVKARRRALDAARRESFK